AATTGPWTRSCSPSVTAGTTAAARSTRRAARRRWRRRCCTSSRQPGGRGARTAAALLYRQSPGWAPRRDVILALTAGEESGLENGIEWLLAHRRDLFDVAWAWNADGGGGTSRGGRRVAFDVELAEKLYQSFTLTVRNAGGHSSVP